MGGMIYLMGGRICELRTFVMYNFFYSKELLALGACCTWDNGWKMIDKKSELLMVSLARLNAQPRSQNIIGCACRES